VSDPVDLFAGPGGWDQGAKGLGINTIGLEQNADACRTGVAAGHTRIQTDVAAENPFRYIWHPQIASPPCQGFTYAGRGRGREDAVALSKVALTATPETIDEQIKALRLTVKDQRSALALEPLRWALRADPEWVAWEQVPAVLPLWEACAVKLRAGGYNVVTGIVHAEQYGVPQTRKRAILMAHRSKQVTLPEPTHSKYNRLHPEKLDGNPKWVSMAEALGWEEPHLVGFPRRDDGRAGGAVEIDGVAYRARDFRHSDLPAQAVTEKIRSWTATPVAAVEGDTSWVYRRPSPTIVGSFRPDIVAAPGYRKAGDGPRQKQPGSIKITVEQAAVLQSFPHDYPFKGSPTARFRQVGDAVPPLLAQHILKGLI
jgi:DNA (cytosine-5)-methyltransferase 1